MHRLIRFGALLMFPAVLCACSLLIREPQVALKDALVVGLDPAGITVEFHLLITNPNSFDLALLGYTYDVRVMGLPMAGGGSQEALAFPAERDTEVRLPVHLSYSNLLEILKRRPDPDRIPFRLNTRLQVKTPLGESLIPVLQDGTMNVPDTFRPEALRNRLRSTLQNLR